MNKHFIISTFSVACIFSSAYFISSSIYRATHINLNGLNARQPIEMRHNYG